jgi:spermidine synthase
MSELANTYTCIEINPQIYEKALEWAKDKPNVDILFGNWIDVIPTLNKKFDGIFMDTHSDENYKEFEEYCKSIANENCVLSMFKYTPKKNTSELNHYSYAVSSKNIHIINWTYFINGNFIKKNNHIKFKSPNYLI